MIYILGYKRRFGNVIEELTVERTSPLEAIEGLGGLFQTARARILSVRVMHQYLNLHLSALLRHQVDLSNPETRERLATRSSVGRAELDSYADAVANAASKNEFPDHELIQIARTATHITRSLTMDQPLPNGQPLLASLKVEIGRVIEGQEAAIESLLVALVAAGHVLIEGVPVVAKTLLARSLAAAMNAMFSRIQFTPDLMSADITGVNVFEPKTARLPLPARTAFCRHRAGR